MSLWHLRLNLSPPSWTPALRWNWAWHTYRAVCLCQWEGWIACTRHLTPRHWGSSKCLINPSVVPPTNRRVKCFQQALGDVWILMHGAASVKVCQFFLSSDLKFLSLLRPLQFMLHCDFRSPSYFSAFWGVVSQQQIHFCSATWSAAGALQSVASYLLRCLLLIDEAVVYMTCTLMVTAVSLSGQKTSYGVLKRSQLNWFRGFGWQSGAIFLYYQNLDNLLSLLVCLDLVKYSLSYLLLWPSHNLLILQWQTG